MYVQLDPNPDRIVVMRRGSMSALWLIDFDANYVLDLIVCFTRLGRAGRGEMMVCAVRFLVVAYAWRFQGAARIILRCIAVLLSAEENKRVA
jgi:hypothetical protein